MYLYESEEAATNGDTKGARGTGFLVSHHWEDVSDFRPRGHTGPFWPKQTYIVTASHVVERGAATAVRYMRPTSSDGVFFGSTPEVLTLASTDWVHHPAGDDVAVAAPNLDLGPYPHAWHLISDMRFLSEKVLDHTAPGNIGVGDDVFMVGRFINHEGRKRNLPVVRFGTIAMMPDEPIHQGRDRNFNQESFLIECRSHPGFSGSPVFVYVAHAGYEPTPPTSKYRSQPPPPNPFFTRGLLGNFSIFLLGLDWGQVQDSSTVVGTPALGHVPIPMNTGMAGVVPAWKIREVLAVPALVEARREAGARFAAKGRAQPHD